MMAWRLDFPPREAQLASFLRVLPSFFPARAMSSNRAHIPHAEKAGGKGLSISKGAENKQPSASGKKPATTQRTVLGDVSNAGPQQRAFGKDLTNGGKPAPSKVCATQRRRAWGVKGI